MRSAVQAKTPEQSAVETTHVVLPPDTNSHGTAFGGKIIRNKPMHGKVSSIYHYKTDIFKNLSNPFKATRYHSLSVERKSLPSCLKITAELKKNGMIMGLKHKTLSIYGVQFHPESIASQHGHDLIKNFLDLSNK